MLTNITRKRGLLKEMNSNEIRRRSNWGIQIPHRNNPIFHNNKAKTLRKVNASTTMKTFKCNPPNKNTTNRSKPTSETSLPCRTSHPSIKISIQFIKINKPLL